MDHWGSLIAQRQLAALVTGRENVAGRVCPRQQSLVQVAPSTESTPTAIPPGMAHERSIHARQLSAGDPSSGPDPASVAHPRCVPTTEFSYLLPSPSPTRPSSMTAAGQPHLIAPLLHRTRSLLTTMFRRLLPTLSSVALRKVDLAWTTTPMRKTVCPVKPLGRVRAWVV